MMHSKSGFFNFYFNKKTFYSLFQYLQKNTYLIIIMNTLTLSSIFLEVCALARRGNWLAMMLLINFFSIHSTGGDNSTVLRRILEKGNVRNIHEGLEIGNESLKNRIFSCVLRNVVNLQISKITCFSDLDIQTIREYLARYDVTNVPDGSKTVEECFELYRLKTDCSAWNSKNDEEKKALCGMVFGV